MVLRATGETADRLEKALRSGGLRVFRDARFDEFDTLTAELVDAAAGARVLLAHRQHGPAENYRFFTDAETLQDFVERIRRKVAADRRPAFVGRHPMLRTVHHALGSRPVVVLRGLPGTGKTTLAEQYARLFPGQVLRTGPFGHLDPDDFLPGFHLALARAAADRLDADVAGLDLDRLRGLLADRIGAAPGRVLVLVDDVPAGLPPAVLERLLVPAELVRTLVTSRFTPSPWAAETVDLPGLTPDESLRLVTAVRPLADDAEREAVLRFAARCDGHPMTLHTTAAVPGPITGAEPDSAPEAVRNLLRELGPLPRDLLRLGAVLAPAPLPPEVARAALGSPGATEFDAAVEDLVTHGFATRDGDDLRLQALAVEVAQGEFGELLGQAPEAVLDGGLLQHARVLADHASAHRVRLLRPVAAAFEDHGDPATAGEIHAAILSTGEATSADLTAAARVEIACGLHSEAVEHARAALALAVDEPGRLAAGLIAAQALDGQGDYAEADRLFWQAEPLPAGAQAAAARARRLRGHPRDAVTLLESAEPDDDLERARSLLQAGDPRRARDVAAEVVARHQAAGCERHPRYAEAQLVHADAVLALGPADRKTDYARQYGPEHPLALAASVLADRARLARHPDAALKSLAATEQVVLRVFGDNNPLHLRIRHGMGLAHARLREFDRQADLLEGVVGPQIRLLGRSHPETVESRLDLGLALALSGRGPRERATTLVDDAAREAVGSLAAKARAARQLVRIPQPFMTALFTFERLVWPG